MKIVSRSAKGSGEAWSARLRPVRACPRCRLAYRADVATCGLDGERLIETELDPLIGETVGRYLIVQVIGAGATARVYRAVHADLGTDHALKIISGDLAANARMIERLRREAQAASQIRHPNVVSVTAHDTTPEGVTYIVMALAPGRTLARILAREGPLPPERAAGILLQVTLGLDAAHRSGFIHRDLKPGNLMLDRGPHRDTVKILDFGLVAALPEVGGAREARLTRVGHFTGTPQYAAPELIRSAGTGTRDLTPASDFYALGAVLYEMLGGRPPFEGTTSELLGQHLRRPPPPLPPGAHAGLDRLALALLEKAPRDRPGTAKAVVRALVDLGLAPRDALSAVQEPGLRARHARLLGGPRARAIVPAEACARALTAAARIVRRGAAELLPYFATGALAAAAVVGLAARPPPGGAPRRAPALAPASPGTLVPAMLQGGLAPDAPWDEDENDGPAAHPRVSPDRPSSAAPGPGPRAGPEQITPQMSAPVRPAGGLGARARPFARGRRRSPR